jgi:hypothetical protein
MMTRPMSFSGWRAAAPGEGCRERRRALHRYPRQSTMILRFRRGSRFPRKIRGRKDYSKRTTRPIPSRKPSPGRRTTAATAGSPSRPCDRPPLATVTGIAPRRLERLAGHNVDHAADALKAERAIDRSFPGCRSLVAWIGVTILTIGQRSSAGSYSCSQSSPSLAPGKEGIYQILFEPWV